MAEYSVKTMEELLKSLHKHYAPLSKDIPVDLKELADEVNYNYKLLSGVDQEAEILVSRQIASLTYSIWRLHTHRSKSRPLK